ncbi:DNA cytosine methyltransferase [Bacillus salipaludis]|uniref:DNA (cytosine-5-)-methyltransferase n=1 Tax=Bacillus salipaludis TaxID=2547811 RepID=A0ABW8REP8_9BACI
MGEKNYNPEGGMTGAYRRLQRGKKCPPLTTNPMQRNTICGHPFENRPLSVAEYKRGRGIPVEYQLVGSVLDKYKQIGNAAPRELAATISSTKISRTKTKVTMLDCSELDS